MVAAGSRLLKKNDTHTNIHIPDYRLLVWQNPTLLFNHLLGGIP